MLNPRKNGQGLGRELEENVREAPLPALLCSQHSQQWISSQKRSRDDLRWSPESRWFKKESADGSRDVLPSPFLKAWMNSW